MDRIRRALVVIAAAAGFLGVVLLGDAGSSAGRESPRVTRSSTPTAEPVSRAPATCTASAGRSEPGAFCPIDARPARVRAWRSGGATR